MEFSEYIKIFGDKPGEFEKNIVEIKQRYKYGDDMAHITLKLTAVCNYHCEYCCNIPGEKTKITPVHDIMKFIPYLEEIPHENFFFYLFGGEPTVHPHIKDVCIALAEKSKELGKTCRIVIQSNAYWSIDKFEKFYSGLEDYEIATAISYHPTETNFKQILKVAKWLRENGRLDGVNVLVPDLKDIKTRKLELLTLRKILKASSINLLPIFQILNEAKVNKEFLETDIADKDIQVTYYDENGELKRVMMQTVELAAHRIMHFKGMMCNSGICLVDTDGYIYKCWASFAEDQRVLNYIHTADEAYSREQFRHLISKPMLCPYNTCACEESHRRWRPGEWENGV